MDLPGVTPFEGAGIYELFFVAASGAVVILAPSAHVVGRRIGHQAAVVGTLALVGAFTFAGAFGGLSLAVARVPVALAAAFLYLPTGVGWVVTRLTSDADPEAVARVFPGAWMIALVTALVSQAIGPGLEPLVAGTPALFGIDGYVGFLGYTAAVGVVVGLAARLLLSGDRATRVVAGLTAR